MNVGDKIDEFELIRPLGEGGMGQVWLAKDSAMDREVAIKTLKTSITSDQEFVERFLREIRNAGKLQHKNIVKAYNAGQCEGMYYLVMQAVDGREVEAILEERGPLPEKHILNIAAQLADALDYAWRDHSILHRDVKPSNILIQKGGHPYLMDFGISKAMSEEVSLTVIGSTLGTPYYMSTEQARGDRDLDERSDIYSLGATLFHLLTGAEPYSGNATVEVFSKVLNDPLPIAVERNPNVSDGCSILLQNMMAKDRDDRYRNWSEVKADIAKLQQGMTISKKQVHARTPASNSASTSAPQASIKKTITALVIVLVLLLIGIMGGLAIMLGT